MAHYAQLDSNNVVTQVIVVANEELLNNGVEDPVKGAVFCQSLLGGNWIQTSYNGRIRKNYAGIGYTYDSGRNAFIPPKTNCHTEETLDEATCLWVCANTEHEVANGN
jgi:hypothetical protein